MDKRITKSQLPSLVLDDWPVVQAHPQVVVLIPDDFENNTWTRRVWDVASACGAHIQLLTLCQDTGQEPGVRRRLIAMASLLHHGNVTADWNIQFGTNWVGTVKQHSQPEDLIICFAEQRAGLLQRPLGQILQSSLKNPVYILSGLASQSWQQASRDSQVLSWVGSLSVLGAAFLLQMQIVSVSTGWLQTTLLILSVIAEAVLIGGWNSLFG